MKIDDILGFERPEVFKQLDKLNRDMEAFAQLTGVPKNEWQFHSSSIPELNAFEGLPISAINDVLKLIDSVTPLKYLPKFDADKFLVKVTGVQAIQDILRVLNHAKENETPESVVIDELNALRSFDVDSCEISEGEAKNFLAHIFGLLIWAYQNKKKEIQSILCFILGLIGEDVYRAAFPDEKQEEILQTSKEISQKQDEILQLLKTQAQSRCVVIHLNQNTENSNSITNKDDVL